jgi:ribonuclease P/MRP protein subunit RPP1
MLYDLSIAWTPSTSQEDLENTLRFSKTLGYDVVAVNHVFAPPVKSSKFTNPFKSLKFADASSSDTNNDGSKQQQPPLQHIKSPLPQILHRATVIMTDKSTNYFLPKIAAEYDLVAVRPTTADTWNNVCTSTNAPLISLDLTAMLPFIFKPTPCMAAVSRGVRFEICYHQCLGATEDRKRQMFISNMVNLVRCTKGRGLVISSEVQNALQVRAPADVVNLLAVWGLSTERGMEALGVNPRGVVVNERLIRTGFSGVVDIIQTAAAADGTKPLNTAKEPQEVQPGRKQKKNGNKRATSSAHDRQHADEKVEQQTSRDAEVSQEAQENGSMGKRKEPGENTFPATDMDIRAGKKSKKQKTSAAELETTADRQGGGKENKKKKKIDIAREKAFAKQQKGA